MAASFHAPLVIARPTVTYAGNCGCGCSGSGECGQYGVFPPVLLGILLGGVGQFTGYKNYNNEAYALCPAYTKAVDDFIAFREKVVALYGKFPKIGVSFGGKGRETPKAKDKNLRDERSAERHLQNLKSRAKAVLQKCKGQLKAGAAPEGSELPAGAETVALETQTAAGGNTLLYAGAGVVGLAAVALLFAAKRRRAAQMKSATRT
jgi:hypothetical protein